MDREELSKRRKQRRREIDEWKGHAASYFGSIGGFALIDWFTGDGFDWFLLFRSRLGNRVLHPYGQRPVQNRAPTGAAIWSGRRIR